MAGWENVNAGDNWRPPTVDVHNAMLAAAKAHRGRIKQNVPSVPRNPYSLTIDIQNNTGATVERGNAVAVASTLYEPTTDDLKPWTTPVTVATTPTWPDDSGRLAIITETIPDQKFGRAVVAGLVVARVEVLDTDHRWVWFADNSPDWLKTGTGGQMKIVGTVPSVGTDKYVLVDLCREQSLWMFCTTAGPTFDLCLLSGVPTGYRFTLKDPLDYFNRVDESGWQGHVTWVNDQFWPAGAPCEKPTELWAEVGTWDDTGVWTDSLYWH